LSHLYRDPPTNERRRYPRARGGLQVSAPPGVELVDVSPYGALLRGAGGGSRLVVRLRGEARLVDGEARCLVAERRPDGLLRVIFETIDPAIQQELLRVTKAQALCDGIRETGARGQSGAGFRVPHEPDVILGGLARSDAALTFSQLHRGRPLAGRCVAYAPETARLQVALPAGVEPELEGEPVWACAVLEHESVLLKLAPLDAGAGRVVFQAERLLLTQRRADERQPLPGAWVEVAGQRLPIRDISSRGLAAVAGPGCPLAPGVPAAAVLHRGRGDAEPVTLLPRYRRPSGDEWLIGASLLPPEILADRPPLEELRWRQEAVGARLLPAAVPTEKIHFGEPERRLVGSWNEAAGPGPKTLVVIPPAWGRTKESSALLAQLIAASFAAAGRHAAVLRFDYAETLGESHRSCVETGREALHFTVTGGVADIRRAVDVGAARLGDCRVALVGMSFSGPFCLRVAATDPRVTCLAQLMGASDIQDLIRTATGGIDYVARYRAGIHSGPQNVLGLITDPDRWCADGLEAGMLELAGAQRDAALLRVPVLWICGDHDAFVNVERVRSVLEASPAPRRCLARLACGHVPSKTREAVFAAGPLLQFLLDPDTPGEASIALALPEQGALEAAVAAEWAAAPRARLEAPRDYWRGYMLGKDAGALGYEVLTLTREYRDMMARQVALLEPRPEGAVHDLGGGLGHSLPHLAENGPLTVNLYDLVPQLLDTARRRWRGLPLTLHTHPWDATGPLPEALLGADRVLMSLFLSVLPEPRALLERLAGALAPGAVVVASSVRPDADLSVVYTRLVQDVIDGRVAPPAGWSPQGLVQAIRDYMSSAAWLLRLAEEGTFRLYEPADFAALFTSAGFTVEAVELGFGDPARAVIIRATTES